MSDRDSQGHPQSIRAKTLRAMCPNGHRWITCGPDPETGAETARWQVRVLDPRTGRRAYQERSCALPVVDEHDLIGEGTPISCRCNTYEISIEPVTDAYAAGRRGRVRFYDLPRPARWAPE